MDNTIGSAGYGTDVTPAWGQHLPEVADTLLALLSAGRAWPDSSECLQAQLAVAFNDYRIAVEEFAAAGGTAAQWILLGYVGPAADGFGEQVESLVAQDKGLPEVAKLAYAYALQHDSYARETQLAKLEINAGFKVTIVAIVLGGLVTAGALRLLGPLARQLRLFMDKIFERLDLAAGRRFATARALPSGVTSQAGRLSRIAGLLARVATPRAFRELPEEILEGLWRDYAAQDEQLRRGTRTTWDEKRTWATVLGDGFGAALASKVVKLVRFTAALPGIKTLNHAAGTTPGAINALMRFPGRVLQTGLTNMIVSPVAGIGANYLVYRQAPLPTAENLWGSFMGGVGRTNTISPFSGDAIAVIKALSQPSVPLPPDHSASILSAVSTTATPASTIPAANPAPAAPAPLPIATAPAASNIPPPALPNPAKPSGIGTPTSTGPTASPIFPETDLPKESFPTPPSNPMPAPTPPNVLANAPSNPEPEPELAATEAATAAGEAVPSPSELSDALSGSNGSPATTIDNANSHPAGPDPHAAPLPSRPPAPAEPMPSNPGQSSLPEPTSHFSTHSPVPTSPPAMAESLASFPTTTTPSSPTPATSVLDSTPALHTQGEGSRTGPATPPAPQHPAKPASTPPQADTSKPDCSQTPPPLPPKVDDWQHQAKVDLEWLAKVDRRLSGFLHEIEQFVASGGKPGEYRQEELGGYRKEVREYLPQETQNILGDSTLVTEAVQAGAAILWLVDLQFSRGEGGPLPPVGGTVWVDMPAAYNNGLHTRQMTAGSMEYSRAVIAFITMMSIIGNPGYTTYLPVVWTLLNTLNKLVLLNFVAGLAHDIVQGHGRGFDERLAAAIVALITKLFMPDTYRELEKHRVHPGHYTYDSVIATTFIQHEMRQAITPGGPHSFGQYASAIGDLFLIAGSPSSATAGVRAGIKDLSMEGHPNYANLPEIARRHSGRGHHHAHLRLEDYLYSIQRDDHAREKFLRQQTGQSWFTENFAYPDSAVDLIWPWRRTNLVFLEAVNPLLKSGAVTPQQYYTIMQEYEFWGNLPEQVRKSGGDPAHYSLLDYMYFIERNEQLRHAFVHINMEYVSGFFGINSQIVPEYPIRMALAWATLRRASFAHLKSRGLALAHGGITIPELYECLTSATPDALSDYRDVTP
ncbi:hypothetical protein [Nonomuraea recticatena]|uniref:WXG100-like domain-containing protein n=1 Tax=Nonomuraea recticatena TaxID=46178 RepID=UPI0031F8605F